MDDATRTMRWARSPIAFRLFLRSFIAFDASLVTLVCFPIRDQLDEDSEDSEDS
jgi:hypothetical protein